jgi:hypothetical protein
MTTQLQSDRAYKIHRQLVELKHTVEASGLIMGKLLYDIQEQQIYQQLGYGTFEEYLADPELSFKRSTAYNLKKTYKQWVLDYGYSIDELGEIGFERLLEVGKVATPETKDSWLNKAQALSRSDLLTEVAEHKGNDGRKDYLPLPRFKRCEETGKWDILDKDLICPLH